MFVCPKSSSSILSVLELCDVRLLAALFQVGRVEEQFSRTCSWNRQHSPTRALTLLCPPMHNKIQRNKGYHRLIVQQENSLFKTNQERIAIHCSKDMLNILVPLSIMMRKKNSIWQLRIELQKVNCSKPQIVP